MWASPARRIRTALRLRHSLAGAAASRFAWPTLWNDLVAYGEELRDILEPVAGEASLSPDNISLAQERLESQVGKQAAE